MFLTRYTEALCPQRRPDLVAAVSKFNRNEKRIMKKTISYLYVILGAACWGFIGLFNRMLGEAGVSVWNRVFIRNFISLVLLTVVFALFHRQVFRIKLKHLPIFLCSGLLSILTLSLVYFQCQTMCSLSVAAVLLYLAPSFVVIFSAVLWKTPQRKNIFWNMQL